MKRLFMAFCLVILIAISPAGITAASSEVLFEHFVVDSQGPGNIWLKTVGDLNGDGKTDLIVGGNTSGGLVWYENPSWAKHTIALGDGFSTDGEVVDMDNDGDKDVVVLTIGDIRWYENPNWSVHIIANQVLHDVEATDLDGDGDVDLVARDQGEFGHTGDQLHLYRQDSPLSWTHRSIAIANGEGLKVADFDGDHDKDIVIGAVWLENTKNIIGGAWAQYSYTSGWTYANAFVGAGDINKDGRVDIVLAPSEPAGGTYRISWFQAPADPKSPNWTEHVVENSVETVHHFVGVADMNNDGNPDIVSAEMQQGSDPDEVKVYLNGDGAGGLWQKQVLATTGSHSIRILDVENDGDQDLFGANWQSNQVDLWVNKSMPSAPTKTNTPVAPTATQISIQTDIPTVTQSAPSSSGPMVITEVNPVTLNVGGTALVSVNLENIPSDGYKSAEFTCTYDPGVIEKSNVVTTNLFGIEPVVAIHELRPGAFIVAMAGSNSNRAATNGTSFTFSVKGLQVGQSLIQCAGRVSKGDNIPISIPSTGSNLSIGVVDSPTPTGSPEATPTILPESTSTPVMDGEFSGQAIASKSVTVTMIDANNLPIASVVANPDGTFSIAALAGDYTVLASASGFLSHQGSVTITGGNISQLPIIHLLAGDVDRNNVIDQFDALTIGMNYTSSTPIEADLNNDGVIDFLDLELLAENYRMTGPVVWE